MSKPTIAITGATGFIGYALSQHLVDAGFKVVSFVRFLPYTPPGTTGWFWELERPLEPSKLAGVDCVIHCAYARAEDHAEAEQLNTTGAQHLLDAAKAANVSKLVFLSSMSAAQDAPTAYGRQKWAIEQLLDPSRDLILRPGLVVGRGGLMQEMTAFIRKWKAAPLISGGKQPLQYLALTDLLHAITTGSQQELTGIHSLAHPATLSYKQFYQQVFAHLNLPARLVPLPYPVLKTSVNMLEFLGIQPPVSGDSVRGVAALREHAVSESLKQFGLEPTDLAEAIKVLY